MTFVIAGPIACDAVLEAVVGRIPDKVSAPIPDCKILWDGLFGRIAVVAGMGGDCWHLRDLTQGEEARLAAYLTCLGAAPGHCRAEPRLWSFPARASWGLWDGGAAPMGFQTKLAAAICFHIDQHGLDATTRRLGNIAGWVASQERAESQAQGRLLTGDPTKEVTLLDRSLPYADFFAVQDMTLTHRRFDGELSPVLRRAVFVSGDAVVVLPYDPKTDCVLLVEQLRMGPLARGDLNPWQIEAVAGRIDPGEDAKAAGAREAAEEAGLILNPDDLRPIASYYPSPGTSAEHIYAFLALADLAALDGHLGGHAAEQEDIRIHVMTFDSAMGLIGNGGISNAVTLICLYWLAQERVGLRG